MELHTRCLCVACAVQLNTVRHSNLALFYGACLEPPNACVLWEYCAKGSVRVRQYGHLRHYGHISVLRCLPGSAKRMRVIGWRI